MKSFTIVGFYHFNGYILQHQSWVKFHRFKYHSSAPCTGCVLFFLFMLQIWFPLTLPEFLAAFCHFCGRTMTMLYNICQYDPSYIHINVFLLFAVTYHIRFPIKLLGKPKNGITLDVAHGSLYVLVMYLLLLVFCLVCVGFVFVFCHYDNEVIWCTSAYDTNDK